MLPQVPRSAAYSASIKTSSRTGMRFSHISLNERGLENLDGSTTLQEKMTSVITTTANRQLRTLMNDPSSFPAKSPATQETFGTTEVPMFDLVVPTKQTIPSNMVAGNLQLLPELALHSIRLLSPRYNINCRFHANTVQQFGNESDLFVW